MNIGDTITDLFGNSYFIKDYIKCDNDYPLYGTTNKCILSQDINTGTTIIISDDLIFVIYNVYLGIYIMGTLSFIKYEQSKDIRYGQKITKNIGNDSNGNSISQRKRHKQKTRD